jgi:nitric oxide synthase oxygenase domain/subunit
VKAGWNFDFSEYENAIQQVHDGVNKVSREALDDIASVVQSAMKSACPSDKLRPFIKVFTPSGEGDFNYKAIGYVRDAAYTPKEIAVAANSVEFGSVHNAPMPHIRPTVSRLRNYVKQHIAAKLKAAGYIDG